MATLYFAQQTKLFLGDLTRPGSDFIDRCVVTSAMTVGQDLHIYI